MKGTPFLDCFLIHHLSSVCSKQSFHLLRGFIIFALGFCRQITAVLPVSDLHVTYLLQGHIQAMFDAILAVNSPKKIAN